MKNIFVYQIVDKLSESVIHTFMAANSVHAARQFSQFLDSLKGKVHREDFVLIEAPDAVSICESFDDAFSQLTSVEVWSLTGDNAASYSGDTDES